MLQRIKQIIKRGAAEVADRIWPRASFQDHLRENASSNGAEMHALLAFRHLRYVAERLDRSLEGTVLELGGYSHPGLALVFLLAGSDRYILNNITPVSNRMPLDYAQNIFVLLELSSSNRKDLFDVVELIPGTREVRIRAPQLEIMACQDAATLELTAGSIDFAFTITVLEHLEDPAPLLRKTFKLLRAGSWCLHGIDMRDHACFDDPLRFLHYSAAQFKQQQPGNSRFRASDYRREFEQAGFNIEHQDLVTSLPTRADGSTDCLYHLSRPLDRIFVQEVTPATTWVSEEGRRHFDPAFHHYSCEELSILCTNIAAGKPVAAESIE